MGLVAVLSTCVTAGFAGVYFEMMLKDGTPTSLWIRNMQMYLCGIASTGFGVFVKDYSQVAEKGFFFGYNREVWAIVCKFFIFLVLARLNIFDHLID